MIQTVQKLERSINSRREQDISLVNWWLYMLLLMPITLLIYGMVVYFQRIGRINNFISRKSDYYANVLDFTEKYATEHGQSELIHNELTDLRNEIDHSFSQKIKPIPAGLSLFLTLITVGLWYFVVLYKMNRFWYDVQIVEQLFDDKLSVMWEKLDIIKYPLSFRVDSSKNRSFGLYLFLTLATCFIWSLVWDYKIHTDPDRLYAEFHAIENTVLQTVRQL